MNRDVIAEIIASSFDSDRPVSRRYSACVILHALNKYPTSKTIGYGDSADGALNNAIHNALRYGLMHAGTYTLHPGPCRTDTAVHTWMKRIRAPNARAVCRQDHRHIKTWWRSQNGTNSSTSQ